MLHASLTISCPACGGRVASDARSCIHCDIMARDWPGPALRPLILPGTAGFTQTSPARARDSRIVGTTLAMSVLAAALLITIRVAEDKRDTPRAIAATLGVTPVPVEPGSTAWVMLPAIAAAPADPAPRRDLTAVALADSAAARNVTASAAAQNVAPSAATQNVAPSAATQNVAPSAATQNVAPSAGAQRVAASAAAGTVPDAAPTPDRLRIASRAPIVADAALASSADSAVTPVAIAHSVVPNAVSQPRAVAPRVGDAPVVPRDSIFATVSRRLDASDVRSAVTEFVTALPARTATNGDLMSFYSEGAEHRVALLDDPATVSAAAASVRVMFDIRLSKFDAVGRQLTRILPVSMIVAKRDGDVSASAVTFGALRKP